MATRIDKDNMVYFWRVMASEGAVVDSAYLEGGAGPLNISLATELYGLDVVQHEDYIWVRTYPTSTRCETCHETDTELCDRCSQDGSTEWIWEAIREKKAQKRGE